ncbi:MAG: YdcF family protein [Luteococcus japonicus]
MALLFFGYVGYGVLYQRLARSSKPDYIVTLGSGLIRERVPPLLAGRIDGALDLYRRERAAGRRPLLVMSGGKGSDELVAEAVAMARYALDRGIPAEDLLLEDQSATTEQNLRLTTDVMLADPRLGPGARGVAVTSNYHAMRAALLASEIGVPVQVVGTRTADYFWPSAMLREFVAVMKGFWRMQVLVFCLVTLPLPLFLAWAMMR